MHPYRHIFSLLSPPPPHYTPYQHTILINKKQQQQQQQQQHITSTGITSSKRRKSQDGEGAGDVPSHQSSVGERPGPVQDHGGDGGLVCTTKTDVEKPLYSGAA